MVLDSTAIGVIVGAVLSTLAAIVGQLIVASVQARQLKHERELKALEWEREQDVKAADEERQLALSQYNDHLEAYKNTLYYLAKIDAYRDYTIDGKYYELVAEATILA